MKPWMSIVCLCLLTACFDKTATRQLDPKTAVSQMDCAALANERIYQYRVLAGAQTHTTNQTALGNATTTVMTLGYNHLSNSLEGDDRDDRALSIKKHIFYIEETQRQKGCV
jgi:hypothetical protein